MAKRIGGNVKIVTKVTKLKREIFVTRSRFDFVEGFCSRHSPLRGNVQFDFQFLQSMEQSRQPLLFAAIVKRAQLRIGLAFATRTLGQLVGGKTPRVAVRAGERRCLGEDLRSALMVFV